MKPTVQSLAIRYSMQKMLWDSALDSGTLRIALETKGKAMQMTQQCYAYRKALRALGAADQLEPYMIQRDHNILTLRRRDETFQLLEGKISDKQEELTDDEAALLDGLNLEVKE